MIYVTAVYMCVHLHQALVPVCQPGYRLVGLGTDGWPGLQVEVFRQLARLLVLLHEHGMSTSSTAPLCYSSVWVVPGASAGQLAVRWAPWEAPPGSTSFIWQADGLCLPPESASAESADGADPQKGDVWRAAAVAVVTLAANWLEGGDRKPTIRDMLCGLQGRIPSHLVIVLKVPLCRRASPAPFQGRGCCVPCAVCCVPCVLGGGD